MNRIIRQCPDLHDANFRAPAPRPTAAGGIAARPSRGPATAILTWTPDRLATYAVEVYALNGRAVSQPAQITLQGVSGPAVTSGDTATTCTARIMVSELNFRDGPSTTAGRLGQFDTGETVQVIGQNTGGTWYQVQRFNNEQGWVINNSQWLATEGQCESLSVTE